MLRNFVMPKRFAAARSSLRYTTLAQQKINSQETFTPGKEYYGFMCKRAEYIADFNMSAMIFEHEKTGLQYVHIDRNDSNNLFSINFRTTPFDSTGLPHILEHSVLCGSKKYPVRDPFFKMLNRSLATFMNAMTGPDYTLYPFSSTNEKDYRNLQHIYMDAVFNPNLKYLDFLQEGWRLENKDLNDMNSEHIFKGVVYNEMKGAFAENSQVFGQHIFNKLLPEHTYQYVSGGDPEVIPNLTHQDLVNFHQKYYHPSNSRIISYGNFELDKNLSYVNDYLSDFERIDSAYSHVPNQTRWNEPRRSKITCRYDSMGAPIQKQNQIAVGYLMTDICDIYETFVLQVLTELMVKGPNSYFYKSLIEPNISGGYNSVTGYDPTIKDTMLTIGLQDVDKNDFEKVLKIFDATIDQAIEKGFEEKHINSVLHNLELQMRHQTTKFGLGLLFTLTPLMNHDGDVIEMMKLSNQISTLKENMRQNPKYLQEKVQQYFKDNRHKLILTMEPDAFFEAKFTEVETKNLNQKVEKLSESDRQKIFDDGNMLATVQKAKEDINILPCLKIEDIKTPERSDLEFSKVDGTPLQLCKTDTNGIVYFQGLLDASNLSDDERKLLPLFAELVTQFGTKKHDYREFDNLVASKTAGLGFNVHLGENIDNNQLYEIGLQFGSYCLKENSQDLFEILSDLLTTVEFNDVLRFEMLLESYLSNLSVGIAQSGHLFAIQNASGLVSESGKLRESMIGIEHLNHMKNLLQSKTMDDILNDVREIGKKLLQKRPARCALNVADDDANDSISRTESFLKTLKADKSEIHWNKSNLLTSNSRHNVMHIPVNYCAKSLNTVPYAHKDFPALRVLARILSSKYLLPVVREQNGAYGAGAKLGFDGIFSFFSYRDPNSTKTISTFDDSFAWVTSNLGKTIDKQALFEAKLGVLQQLDAPVSGKDKGMETFKYGVTHETFTHHRNSILNTSLDNIKDVSEKYLADDAKTVVGRSIIGPSNEELAKMKWIINQEEGFC
jgi:Zn-dependent M16 (insulinase) family peptidase